MERISKQDLPEGLMHAIMQVQAYINKAGLNKSMIELMQTRVSQINCCAYCLDMHSKEAVEAGESIQRLVSVSAWREAPYYAPQERAVLQFAEVLTRLEEGADLDLIHEELLKYFTKQEIALLTLSIAQINLWNRLVKSFGTVAGSYQIQGETSTV